MNVTILGGGPAGLYCGLLLKKASPRWSVRVVERNAPDATYGWGVVFSDRTLAAFQEADYKSYKAITSQFVTWDAIDIYRRTLLGDETLARCGGHIFAGMARKALLATLQERCRELGVALEFENEIASIEALGKADLVIAADGVSSLARRAYEATFQPKLTPGKAKYVWYGADRTLAAFTFIFAESEHGLFQVHSYPFSGETSTFIVECAEDVWLRAGLDQASEAESIAFCENLFARELRGARLLSNNSKWINFNTLKCASWRAGNLVLLGDAAHTAHFSIGSGTKLAMEDAIALANAIEQYPDLDRALSEYELTRRPIVELFQLAAAESQAYFEQTWRYMSLPGPQFAFNLLTRSKRITYDDLRLRDPRFVQSVDRWMSARVSPQRVEGNTPWSTAPAFAPPPAFTDYHLAVARLANHFVTRALVDRDAFGMEREAIERPRDAIMLWHHGAALALTEPVAVASEARIAPDSLSLYTDEQAETWSRMLSQRREAETLICMTLNHAGRRGAASAPTRGVDIPDRPMREGAWPLVSASPIPYSARSQTPSALDCDGMRAVRNDFVRAARMADACGLDMLMLHMAHGYLLASFLSPLANQREDDYGGALENRMRFPLEVFEAVRAAWPATKPLGVALSCHDGARGGLTLDDAVVIAATLKERGCDLIQPLAGQTTPNSEAPYGKGFLTPLSERIRLETGIATLTSGNLTTTDEANTIVAAGRADLVLMLAPASSRSPRREASSGHEAAKEW
jgi:anthraniloyl-CoA monooxygenase